MQTPPVATAEPTPARHGTPNRSRPTISVITPSYNQGPFIARCVESVLAQNYPNFEHIVCDNVSTDETHDVLRRYSHVNWTSHPDRGQSDALNKALSVARGEIIAWINADDAYEAGAFETAARHLGNEGGAQVIAGRVRVVDPDGNEIEITRPHFAGLDYLIDFWSHNYGLAQPGVLMRREVIDRVGPFREDLHYAMDYDYWLRVAEHYDFRIVDDIIARFVVHPQSKTGAARCLGGFREELEQVSRRYWGPVWSPQRWRLARGCNRHMARLAADAIVASHKHDERFAWEFVWELLRRNPWWITRGYVLSSIVDRLLGRRPG